MHRVTFFPSGNADTCALALAGGQRLLFDFADKHDPTDPADKRAELSKILKGEMDGAERANFDVVAFTHLDDDHIKGASTFFWLRHSSKYQSADRMKIDDLWVPAAIIVDDECETEDAAVIRAEARHRLRQKEGIRVFSRPQVLEQWLKKEGMILEDVQHLVTDAGQTVPGWTMSEQGAEFFIHSPFATRTDRGEVVDRNKDALFLQVTLLAGGRESTLILSADVDSDVIDDIVRMTRDVKKRPERLRWDLNNVPHHSSYRSLNVDDKGRDKTTPPERVDWLYRQGNSGGCLVSTSDVIPSGDTDQPPHRQAAAYYRERASAIGGEYQVTMEYPTIFRPEVMIFEIDGAGIRLVKRSVTSGSAAILGVKAPRAGG